MANHQAEVRGSIPRTDVGKALDREIFSPVSDASVYRRTAVEGGFFNLKVERVVGER